MTTQLYRHFDADGVLLYVGVSVNQFKRLVWHKSKSRWFSQIASVTIEHFSSRDAALKAESEAIKHGCPKYNKHHSTQTTQMAVARRLFSERLEGDAGLPRHPENLPQFPRENGVLRLDRLAAELANSNSTP